MKGVPPQLPGLAVAAGVGLAATFVAGLHGGPQMLYALFFGIALNHLSQAPRTKPGVEFGARTVLRLGVGLLGARITATQIAALGWQTAAVVTLAVVSTIAMALFIGRRLGLSRAKSVLAGGAVAICGASAALAISAVLPREKDGERFTLMVVVSVTLLSTVAQVVGAGYTINHQTGDAATVVKLLRVAMLAVVVAVVAFAFRQQRLAALPRADGSTPARQPLLPWFLWLFMAMVLVNSTLGLAPWLQQGLGGASRACLVLAIAALGMKTSFAQLARMGWRPVALIVAETLWLAIFVLAAVLALR